MKQRKLRLHLVGIAVIGAGMGCEAGEPPGAEREPPNVVATGEDPRAADSLPRILDNGGDCDTDLLPLSIEQWANAPDVWVIGTIKSVEVMTEVVLESVNGAPPIPYERCVPEDTTPALEVVLDSVKTIRGESEPTELTFVIGGEQAATWEFPPRVDGNGEVEFPGLSEAFTKGDQIGVPLFHDRELGFVGPFGMPMFELDAQDNLRLQTASSCQLVAPAVDGARFRDVKTQIETAPEVDVSLIRAGAGVMETAQVRRERFYATRCIGEDFDTSPEDDTDPETPGQQL